MDPLNSDKKQVILLVLDGWGLAPPNPGNAISNTKTPNINSLWASYPHTQLSASGEAVGLPRGEVGNTETGHLNIGAGRIVYQDLARINMSIADGSFFNLPSLVETAKHVNDHKSALHLVGLIGAGGVHSNIEHLFALIQFAAKNQIQDVYIHAITDGRDSPPTSSRMYITQVRQVLQREGVGKFASIMGRYWAMDRDKRWDRTAKAYNALTKGDGSLYKTPEEAIEDSYKVGKTDEFIEPSLIMGPDGKPVSLIKENDAVIFFNFRVDRPRQLSRAFVFENINDIANVSWSFDPHAVKYDKSHLDTANSENTTFPRDEKIKNLMFVTMTEYEKPLTTAGARPIFPPIVVEMPLGAVISHQNLKQLRASESEKEKFVTYYFNGQRGLTYPGEEHLIVPSPKVITYDKMPEMSARELTDSVLNKLKEEEFIFTVVNFANVDMVGHTGNYEAAIKAVEVVDECVGKFVRHVLSFGGTLMITADHGNAEEMLNRETGEVSTEHTGNPVPFIVVGNKYRLKHAQLSAGILGDIAPTILHELGIEPPSSMFGRNLLGSISF